MRRIMAAAAVAGLVSALAGCGTGQAQPVAGGSGQAQPAGSGQTQPGTGSDQTQPTESRMAWQQIPAPPFTPRSGAVAVWTGSEALFFGGDDGPTCPPAADCAAPTPRADGAAYDPAANSWREIAVAPEPIRDYSAHQIVGDTIYVWGTEDLLGYTPETDSWRTFPIPDEAPDITYAALAGVGSNLIAVRGERHAGDPAGHILDPSTGDWSALPKDPLGPTFGRTAVSIPGGVVLLAHDLVPSPNSEKPSVVRAAVLDGTTMTWKQLPDSDLLGEGVIGWSGTHVVIAGLGGADGGQVNNWGRIVPNGGTLDPATGEWSTFADAPEIDYQAIQDGQQWPVAAVGGRYVATSGFVYDDVSGEWTPLTPPADGPARPGDAVWAGNRLLVVGGLTAVPDGTEAGAIPPAPDRVSGAWMLTLSP